MTRAVEACLRWNGLLRSAEEMGAGEDKEKE